MIICINSCIFLKFVNLQLFKFHYAIKIKPKPFFNSFVASHTYSNLFELILFQQLQDKTISIICSCFLLLQQFVLSLLFISLDICFILLHFVYRILQSSLQVPLSILQIAHKKSHCSCSYLSLLY